MRKDIKFVRFTPRKKREYDNHIKPIRIIGLDTEANTKGKCFLVALSTGETFSPAEFPQYLFKRKFQGYKFVVYNLKYEQGALLQRLPKRVLRKLWKEGSVTHDKYTYEVLGERALIIKFGHHTLKIFDIYPFCQSSLQKASQAYLGKSKLQENVQNFTPEYIRKNLDHIKEYCIQDAKLVCELAQAICKEYHDLNIQVSDLYSPAYVSWRHFKRTCNPTPINRFWHYYREVLDYAMQAYAGGKFEVTRKGPGTYYLYDIVSAYPYEISKLYDLYACEIYHGDKIPSDSDYGFVRVFLDIEPTINHSVPYKVGNVNIYPAGRFEKVITLDEYLYLKELGVVMTIIDAYCLHVTHRHKPFESEVMKLIEAKKRYKDQGETLKYNLVKLTLNSLYGKFVQLNEKHDHYQAPDSWHPIYGAIITARVRLRMAKLQNDYPSVCAVHTDSVISNAPLPYGETDSLGELSFQISGEGFILGSGIYQIGSKVRFRGFDLKKPLTELVDLNSSASLLPSRRALTWREVVKDDNDPGMINRFVNIPKYIHVNLDHKRIWLRDWIHFRDAFSRVVDSVPRVVDSEILF